MQRGGSWNNNAKNARSANRNNNAVGNRNNDLGFRLSSPPAHAVHAFPRIVRPMGGTSVERVTMSRVPELSPGDRRGLKYQAARRQPAW